MEEGSILFYAIPFFYTLFQWKLTLFILPKSNIQGICKIAVAVMILYILFHLVIVPIYGNVLLFEITSVPHRIRCPWEYEKCEKGNIDGWSLWHLSDHFVMGLLYPHIKWEIHFIFLQSLMCESGELWGGGRARFVLDPCTNLIGYCIGCVARTLIQRRRETIYMSSKESISLTEL